MNDLFQNIFFKYNGPDGIGKKLIQILKTVKKNIFFFV
jgi:hypothetical protein